MTAASTSTTCSTRLWRMLFSSCVRYFVTAQAVFRSRGRSVCWLAIIMFTILCQLPIDVMAAASPPSSSSSSSSSSIVILLDVDNTLYREEFAGIERQIVRQIHAYCETTLNMSPSEADALHNLYGSTIEGLRQTLWRKRNDDDDSLLLLLHDEKMAHFYNHVYTDDSIQVAPYMLASSTSSSSGSSTCEGSTTGYSHSSSSNPQQQREWACLRQQLLYVLPHVHFGVASNSPDSHVRRVLHALGLARVPWKAGIWTPTTTITRTTKASSSSLSYPTKQQPQAFFPESILLNTNNNNNDNKNYLLDDSITVLDHLPDHIEGILIHTTRPGSKLPATTLLEGLHQALGYTTTTCAANDTDTEPYRFDQIHYLQSKNVVDVESIHVETWKRLGSELLANLLDDNNEAAAAAAATSKSRGRHLDIVDVGAGLLSMLRLVLNGHNTTADRTSDNESPTNIIRQDLPSLVSMLTTTTTTTSKGNQNRVMIESIDYYAYESNREVGFAAAVQLEEAGFSVIDNQQFESSSGVDCLEWTLQLQRNESGSAVDDDDDGRPTVTVHLRFWDYRLEGVQRPLPTPDLILGCCFADLLDPEELARSVLNLVAKPKSPTFASLVYFPITFTGVTQVLPPQPSSSRSSSPVIPSDTLAFQMYAKALEEGHQHNLDPDRLKEALLDYGATFLASGSSDWRIDPTRHNYLWNTMLYFFGSVAAPELVQAGWDALGWLHRIRDTRPAIQATNVDLLFRIPHLGHCKLSVDTEVETETTVCSDEYEEILFTAADEVGFVKRSSVLLQPNQVRIKTMHSLISSGTELKIFKGLFDDAALDVNIDGMSENRMAFPLAYGYSLVGEIVECGSDVPDGDELLGKLAFTFSAHASEVVTSFDSIQIIPQGVDPLDAIFMPSVETALSIVHDAHVRYGEDVAVFGQGLIGLLVTAVMRRQGIGADGKHGSLSSFDFVPDRVAMSARMGASQALFPTMASQAGPFDLSIEVSGNGKGLQSAIDNTRDGGRIVVGSWYGNKPLDLKLGIDFHRSHKTIKTSQVSDLPAEMTACWTKERRFALTWELVKSLRPARLLTRQFSLESAQDAYESLEKGGDIAIAFQYREDTTR